jgi:hypothetical protein
MKPLARSILKSKTISILIVFLLLSANCTKQQAHEEKPSTTSVTEHRDESEPAKEPLIIENDVLQQAMQLSEDSLINIIYEDRESYEAILNVELWFESIANADGDCEEAMIVSTRHSTKDSFNHARYSILTLQDGIWNASYEDFDFDTDKQHNTSLARTEIISLGSHCKFFALQERYREAENLNAIWSYTSLYVVSKDDDYNELVTVLFFPDAYVQEIRDEEEIDTAQLLEEEIVDETFSTGENVERLDLQKLEVLSTYHNGLPDLKMISTQSDTNDTTITVYSFSQKEMKYKKQ